MGRSSVRSVLVNVVAPLSALISAVAATAAFLSGPSAVQPTAEIRAITRPSEAQVAVHVLLRNPNPHRETFEGLAIYCQRIGGDETSYEPIDKDADPLSMPQIVESNAAAAIQLMLPYDPRLDACKHFGVLWFNAQGKQLRGPAVPMVSKPVTRAAAPSAQEYSK